MVENTIYAIAATYALWMFYLAVMNLKRARDNGTLTRIAYYLGLPMFAIGITLDFIVNVIVFSVVMLELPREGLVTARLKRHAPHDTWRGNVARWFALHFLDTFDPSGRHI